MAGAERLARLDAIAADAGYVGNAVRRGVDEKPPRAHRLQSRLAQRHPIGFGHLLGFRLACARTRHQRADRRDRRLVGLAFEIGLESPRSEEPTSELPSLMRISYAVFCLHNKQRPTTKNNVKPQHIT